MALRQLYICDNKIQGTFDCVQLKTLLQFNSRLRYLDLRYVVYIYYEGKFLSFFKHYEKNCLLLF